MDTSFDYIQVLVVIGSGALSWVTFSSSVTPSSSATPSSSGGDARFWSRELGLGGLVSSRLVSGVEVDSSIYAGNRVVV